MNSIKIVFTFNSDEKCRTGLEKNIYLIWFMDILEGVLRLLVGLLNSCDIFK